MKNGAPHVHTYQSHCGFTGREIKYNGLNHKEMSTFIVYR
jgi:hypothetical protein